VGKLLLKKEKKKKKKSLSGTIKTNCSSSNVQQLPTEGVIF